MSILTSKENSIYTIAEMSANHSGSLDRAIEIVKAAKDSGADCLKIQTYMAESLTIDCDNDYFHINSGMWDGYNLYQLYKEAATPYEWQADIKKECDKIGIDFLSTPFDEVGADFLETLDVKAYKIASFELVHIPLIKHIAKKRKPMIISCGMGTVEEIQDAIDAIVGEGLHKEKITLLKCTSEYPAKTEDMNLLTITDMIERFGTKVGLSDHSIGATAPVTAVALGATVIEKHFCLSRDIKNPDSNFSTEPAEFKEMVEAVNAVNNARGEVRYGPTENEASSVKFRRSIFAVKDIDKGELFTKDNIRIIRPGHGIAPKNYENLIGAKAKNKYERGQPIKYEDISL